MALYPFARFARKSPARVATVLVGLFIAGMAPRVYAQVRIAVVNIRQAVAETNEGRAAMAALKTRFDQRQNELNARTKALEAMKRRLENPRGISQAQLQKLGREYYQKVMELQQIGQQYTEELQRLEAEATNTILTKMQPILREVGQSQNYQIIVNEQMVLYAPSHLNLTDLVVQMYNQRYPSPSTAPDAGTAASAPVTTDAGARTTPPSAASPPDTTRRAPLPGVFYRRDAGR